MKKLRIYKKDLEKINDDDLAFVEAYKAIKTPPSEPKEQDYQYVDYSTFKAAGYITEKDLLDMQAILRSGKKLHTSRIALVTTKTTEAYTKDLNKYNAANKLYNEDMTALHPIVSEIMKKAKAK